jgi:2-(1,2-epoxy-1,2-dihydrophenyl)acetyl-CoA isomerase
MTTLDTGTDHLRAEVADGVAVVTMNRPDRRNALSQEMLTAMGQVLAGIEADEDVRCVVLTGAGGAFCAGGDVKGMAARGEQGGAAGDGARDDSQAGVNAAIHHQRLDQRATSLRLWHMPKPTIAAIPGPAAGAGLSLALACDLRFAAAGAVLTTAFSRVALAGDFGGTWFLTRLVGPAKAKELYYFSERVTAEEAERLGLVNAVFPTGDLEGEVMARARRLAAGPTNAYRYMKENINRAVLWELGDCMDIEVTHHIHTAFTEDHREAARAFVEKRDPVFRGR